MARLGQITPEMQVRLSETGKWKKAASVQGLFQTEGNSQPVEKKHQSESNEDIMPSPAADDSSSELSDASEALSSDNLEVKELAEKPNSGNAPQPGGFASSANVPSGAIPAGEVPSVAPPVPGAPQGENRAMPAYTPNPSYNSGSFGEMPSTPPPVPGAPAPGSFSPGSVPPPPLSRSDSLNMSLFPQDNKKNESSKSHSPAIPALIEELISPEEEIYYAGNPTINVLFIRCIIVGILYFFFGFVPTIAAWSGGATGFGFFYFFLSIIICLLIIGVSYVQWLNLFYVITSRRTLVKNGVLSVEVSYIYNDKIQMFSIKTGLIDKILHLNTINLYSSGGKVSLNWVRLEDVLKYYSR